jgi:hypothetical protein
VKGLDLHGVVHAGGADLYPEGGSHALQVCQHHHQVVRVGHFVGSLSGCQRRKEHVARDCSGRFGRNLHGRTAHSVRCATVKVAGGGPSVHACAVFLGAESRDGDKFNQNPRLVLYRFTIR